MQKMIRRFASVITKPWSRWSRAELMDAFRRRCERFALRKAEWIHSAMAIRKEQTTMPPISKSQTRLGSTPPT